MHGLVPFAIQSLELSPRRPASNFDRRRSSRVAGNAPLYAASITGANCGRDEPCRNYRTPESEFVTGGRLFSSRDTSRRCSKNCTELCNSSRRKRERERENCWKRSVTGINSGRREEGLFVTTLWLHIGAQTCLRLKACVFIVLTIVVLDKLVYVHIYKGCLKEANLLRGISLDLSGKGVDLEDLSFATRVPIHLCGNGRGIRSSLSLCLVYCVTDSESDTFTRLEDSFWDLTT